MAKKILRLIKWVIAIFFILIGLIGFTVAFIPGITFALGGIIILPPIVELITNKTGRKFGLSMQILCVIIVFAVGIPLFPASETINVQAVNKSNEIIKEEEENEEEKEKKKDQAAEQKKAEDVKNNEKISPENERIVNATNVTNAQATKINEILKLCEITEITVIRGDESLNNLNEKDEKGYWISSNGIENIFIYIGLDNKINLVSYVDEYEDRHELYANEKQISVLSDYTLTDMDKIGYKLFCEDVIKAMLKSPSTAIFPPVYEFKFKKEKEVVKVQGYVDSQNSFGAAQRNEFQIDIGVDNKLKSVIFEGKQWIK